MTEHRGPGIHRPGTGAHCFALVPFGIPIEEKSSRARASAWAKETKVAEAKHREGQESREGREKETKWMKAEREQASAATDGSVYFWGGEGPVGGGGGEASFTSG